MITNFDYLKKEPQFLVFANIAISAEKIILMDPEASILNCRRAMEFAIKWMYSVDKALERPYQDNLQSLLNAEEYRQLVGPDLDVVTMWRMEIRSSAGMKQCCAWKTCSFSLTI